MTRNSADRRRDGARPMPDARQFRLDVRRRKPGQVFTDWAMI